MAFRLEDASITDIAPQPEIHAAAQAGMRLMSLWPLDAKRLDNDAKYTENLQVRVTRTVASLMTGEDVTIPDAEFVYEGAEEIPGRPQEIVDALISANDACDAMAEYAQTGDTAPVMRGFSILQTSWSEETTHAVAEALNTIESRIGPLQGRGTDADAVAKRLAAMIVACSGLLDVIDAGDHSDDRGGGDAVSARRIRRMAPVMVYANELCERLTIPPICWSAREFAEAIADWRPDGEVPATFARRCAVAANTEWDRHREDLLWDPEEAKKKAKEDDERRSKEALAAKFAHVPESSATMNQ